MGFRLPYEMKAAEIDGSLSLERHIDSTISIISIRILRFSKLIFRLFA